MNVDGVPPQDLDAERGVLGGLLLSPDVMPDVLDVLDADDFYEPKHETLFATIMALFNRGEPVDALTVADALRTDGALERIGGPSYLHQLIAEVPSPSSAGYYARIVAKHATLRRLRTAALRILAGVDASDGTELDDLVNSAQAEVFAATDGRSTHSYTKLADALELALHRIEAAGANSELRGVGTGFRELDRLTGGLRPSQLVIVAARPSIGKSTLALDLARHAAITQRVPTVFFTLEMDAEAVTMRLLAAQASVPLTALDRGTLTPTQWETIAKTAGPLASAPLFIDDSPLLSLASIRAKCRKLRQQHGLGLVIVDYLQLLAGTRRSDSRQVEVAEFSRGLKLLAKELGVPVIALSQLNRGVENRADRKPLLADMRESGAIEQDADLVIFVHREDAYDRDARPGEADLIIAKHRQGPTGVATVAFQSTYARFADMPADRT